jgi:Ca2+-binding RTX toxin-like protein
VGGKAADTLIGNVLNNRLTGGAGNNILSGLDGDDILEAGNGRDLLIGGSGLDNLNGGGEDDLLIAARTTSDSSIPSLNSIQAEWISANSYATRIANLRAGVGAPVVSLKAKVNVLDDTPAVDTLTGGIGTDWYFSAINDVISDLLAIESLDAL